MKAIYRCNFEVRDGQNPAALAEALADTCWHWLFDPKPRCPVPSPRPVGCVSMPQFGVAPGPHAEAVAITDNGSLRWAHCQCRVVSEVINTK